MPLYLNLKDPLPLDGPGSVTGIQDGEVGILSGTETSGIEESRATAAIVSFKGGAPSLSTDNGAQSLCLAGNEVLPGDCAGGGGGGGIAPQTIGWVISPFVDYSSSRVLSEDGLHLEVYIGPFQLFGRMVNFSGPYILRLSPCYSTDRTLTYRFYWDIYDVNGMPASPDPLYTVDSGTLDSPGQYSFTNVGVAYSTQIMAAFFNCNGVTFVLPDIGLPSVEGSYGGDYRPYALISKITVTVTAKDACGDSDDLVLIADLTFTQNNYY